MFLSYLILGYRNLKKYSLSSFINIAGLASAFGCCLMVFEYAYWCTHQDDFNKKIDQLYVIEKVVQKDGQNQNFGNAPALLGPMLKNDFPAVKNVARLNYKAVIIRQGNNVFRDKVTFVDPAFYNMFDFPIKWGDKSDFAAPNSIVLTLELAEKLFGKTNAIDKAVQMTFNVNGKELIENFIVKGVLEKYPVNASFNFSALIPSSKMATLGSGHPMDWHDTADITFIETDTPEQVSSFNLQDHKYISLYNTANPEDRIAAYHYQPLKTMNFHSYTVSNQRFNTMEPIGLIMLVVIAVSILVLVYFNYINIMIASAATRLKEISVRKVMGSSRTQIILQFVVENLIICTLAIFIGFLLAEVLFLPWFSSIANFELGQDLFSKPRTWIAGFLLIVLSALSGALYPAFYITALQPLGMMRGNVQLGSKNNFRKALLGFQFFLTFLAISIAIAFIQETKRIKAKPWGYDPSNTIVLTLDGAASYDRIKQVLKENKNIQSITGAVQPLGNYSREIQITAAGKKEKIKTLDVLPGFIEQLGINVSAGRAFNNKFVADQQSSVLVNKAFLKSMHWDVAVKKSIQYAGRNYTIIGVVDDFQFEDFEYAVSPVILMASKPEEVKSLYIKTSGASGVQNEIKQAWQNLYPDLPFDFHFQETVFDGYFDGFSQISQVLAISSLIMTVISISGVFGLGLIILGRKMKEISIRKILGADLITLSYLVFKEFLFALLIAMGIGVPISIFLTGNLFGQLSAESIFSILPIGLSIFALTLTTAISVSWHIFKAYTANISTYLKRE